MPKQKGTGAKGPSKSAKSDKRADSGQQIKPAQNDFLDQTFIEEYKRREVFIEKLIERLTHYGEDGPKLLAAYKDNTDLPQPKLKTGATTESQSTKYEKEIQSLTKRNQELDTKLKQQKRQLRSGKAVPQNDSENDTEVLKENLQENKDALKTTSDELDNQKQANALLQKQHEDLKAKCRKLENHVEALDALQKENEDVKANFKQQEETLTTLRKDKKDLETDIEKKSDDAQKLQRENSSLRKDRGSKTEVEQIQKEKSDLKRNYEKSLDALKTENAQLVAENTKQTTDIEKLQREKSSLTKDSQGKKKGGGKPDNTSPGDKVKNLEEEVDSLRNRLSKMAGAQLTDNNPAIADLSDPNRPLSLGEKFSELYDNEWTDAMEEMAEKMPDETKVIKLLLDIVIDAYKFCLDKSDKFMEKINGTLSDFSKELSSSKTMPKEIAKTNKDYRKSLAVYVVSCLQQDFTKEASTKAKTDVGDKTEAYMKKCVLVCWFMTVQDPKVCITTEKPEKFDEDLYKPYTKKGKRIDYLVWPVLHLHEGGPLIGKGVAQGK